MIQALTLAGAFGSVKHTVWGRFEVNFLINHIVIIKSPSVVLGLIRQKIKTINLKSASIDL